MKSPPPAATSATCRCRRPPGGPGRLVEAAPAAGALGALPLPAAALRRVEAALEHVTTEASAMAVRCARGETGHAAIRGGRRTVPLTADGGRLVCFDPA